jgi:hypothetical protein
MYSHRTQQMNTTIYLNKQECKIIISREPIEKVKLPHILYRQDRYELSKDSDFKTSVLLGTKELRKGGMYFICQAIRGNIQEYLITSAKRCKNLTRVQSRIASFPSTFLLKQTAPSV